jgi:putative phosphatase
MARYSHVDKPLVRAQVTLKRLCSLEPEWFHGRGIKLVFIDLENTLISYGATNLSVVAKRVLKRLREAGVSVLVTSNAASWSPLEEELRGEGIEYRFQSRKPFSFHLRGWARTRNLRRSNILVIGDQVLTDGLLAVSMRSHFILVTPISTSEPFWSRTQRFIGLLLKRSLVGTASKSI